MRQRVGRRLESARAAVAGITFFLFLAGTGCGGKPAEDERPSQPADGTEHPTPTPGGQAPAVSADGLERPFNPAKWNEYYTACMNTPFAENRASSRLRYPKGNPTISLALVPHTSAYRGTESELQAGRFVGVIRNYLSGDLPEHSIEGGTASAPSTTCVWIERVPRQTNYQAWLVSKTPPAAPTPRPYERTMHFDNPIQMGTCKHSIPAAAWYPRGLDSQFGCEGTVRTTSVVFGAVVEPVDRLMLDVFMYTFWFTCDLTGCCKNA